MTTIDMTTRTAAAALGIDEAAAAETLRRLTAAGVKIVGPKRGPRELTNAESAVGLLIAEGHDNRAIAKALGVAEATVRVQVRSIFQKTQFTNRTQYAVWAKTGVRPAAAPPIAEAQP